MPTVVWLNGEFVERDAARVSAFDAGFQHAIGLFETMLAADGRVFRLFEHLERLQRSARELGLSDSLHLNPLAEAVRRVAERSAEPRARVRLTVSGGSLGAMAAPSARGANGASPTDPTILILAQRAVEHPEALFEQGALAVIGESRLSNLDPLAGHKTLAYWARLRELQRAARFGAAECLLFDTSNRLLSGAVSNVFLVREGRLLTPPARGESDAGPTDAGDAPVSMGEEAARAWHAQAPPPRAVLPGVTRAFLLAEAERMGLETVRGALTVDDMLGADEVLLTNSSWGVLPVCRIEGHVVGAGSPGPVARGARAKWLGALHEQEPE